MARKKEPMKPILTLKGQDADRDWIESLMHHLGDESMADMIRRLLVQEAKRKKFPEPPPFRVPAEWGGRRKPPPDKGVR